MYVNYRKPVWLFVGGIAVDDGIVFLIVYTMLGDFEALSLDSDPQVYPKVLLPQPNTLTAEG